jgi:hypothetical protein
MRAVWTILLAPVLIGAAPAGPDAQVVLTPVSAGGAVTGIDVAFDLANGPADGFALSAPIVYPGAPGVADRIRDIVITDAEGAVATTSSDDPAVPGGFPYFRHWKATRAVQYPVHIRYRSLVMPAGGPGGPAFGIRAVGGGVAGSGGGFLMVPDGEAKGTTTLRWDLSGMPAGSIAGTSFGEGAVTFAGGPARLYDSWIMVGPARRFPAKGSLDGFSAMWLGAPSFDAPAAMRIAARGHDYIAHYFPHLKPTPPYRVFMQFREQDPPGGGTALDQSFMLSQGPAAARERRPAPLITLFHEMIHQWTGQIDMPQGVSSWFSEGLTTYYQDRLPMKGGFESVGDYLDHINRMVESYETSKARNWSAAAITKVGFGDEQVRHTPYIRSALYFYDLDARIRAKSGGKRTLDSLLFPMFVAREKGMRFDEAKWIEMVTGELGPEERGRFERLIIEGTDTIEPRADAFGPCFTRRDASFTVDGRQVSGHQWVRVPGVKDATCRAY